MTRADTPITEVVVSGPSTSTQTRLSGRGLLAARVVWLILFLFAVGLIAVGFINNSAFLYFTGDVTELWSACKGLDLPTDACAVPYIILRQVAVTIQYFAAAVLIFWRKSDDSIALLTSLTLVTLATFGLAGDELYVIVDPFWISSLIVLGNIGLLCFLLLLYLFPDGRFVPRWSLWLAIIAGFVASLLDLVANGQIQTGLSPYYSSQYYLIARVLGNSIFAGSGIIGIGGQVYRYSRLSTPQQRQQSKWIVGGLISIVVWLVIERLLMPNLGSLTLTIAARSIAAIVGYIVVPTLLLMVAPLCVLFSITRYRLWDIDFVINRSLVYGGLTLILLALFSGLFLAARAILSVALGVRQDVAAAVIPAIAITAVFNPTRKWLRGAVDRRLYGINVDYDRANTPSPSPIAAAHTLATRAGVYHNLEPIGRGGMAEVYRANHPTLGTPVAVKILPAELAKQADFRKRFEREASALGALKHPNIVQMLDFGESEGVHYMIMEYIAGHDLGELIRQSAPLPLDRAVPILTDVASALDYAHAQGLVHRDIKPSNVMIEEVTSTGTPSPSGRGGQGVRAVLMDFGIARMVLGGTRLTATGMLGTFDYMSPEQINDARDVDGRADGYALGVMAYQMLTGRLPFLAASAGALLMLHLRQPPPDPREVVAGLPENAAHAVTRAMAKKPEDRFNTTGEFVAALS